MQLAAADYVAVRIWLSHATGSSYDIERLEICHTTGRTYNFERLEISIASYVWGDDN